MLTTPGLQADGTDRRVWPSETLSPRRNRHQAALRNSRYPRAGCTTGDSACRLPADLFKQRGDGLRRRSLAAGLPDGLAMSANCRLRFARTMAAE